MALGDSLERLAGRIPVEEADYRLARHPGTERAPEQRGLAERVLAVSPPRAREQRDEDDEVDGLELDRAAGGVKEPDGHVDRLVQARLRDDQAQDQTDDRRVTLLLREPVEPPEQRAREGESAHDERKVTDHLLRIVVPTLRHGR